MINQITGECVVQAHPKDNEFNPLSIVNEAMNKAVSNQFGKLMDRHLLRDIINESTVINATHFASGFLRFEIDFKSGQIALKGFYLPAFIKLLTLMGFRKRYKKESNDYEFVHLENNIMEPVTVEQMKSRVHAALLSNTEKLIIEHNGARAEIEHGAIMDLFARQYTQVFNSGFAELLSSFNTPLLRDNKNESYFLFANGVLTVTKDKIILQDYSTLRNVAVWKSHIREKGFDFIEPTMDNCQYLKFLNNVSGRNTARLNAMFSAIGYLLHYYNHSSLGRGIILYDETLTDLQNPEGGTGKGIFLQAIEKVRETVIIDGKFIQENDRFKYQKVNESTQVVAIEDLKANYPFESFFSCLTNGWTIEKKNEKQIKLSPEDSPKMLFTCNSILGGNGTSDARRQFIIEFSDYYSTKLKKGILNPVEAEHGLLFKEDVWNEQDWNSFFSLMVKCTQLYLKNGLMPYERLNVERNKIIQRCGSEFAEWVSDKTFEKGKIYKTGDFFQEYKAIYYGDNSEYSQRSFTKSLKNYASIMGLQLACKRSNGETVFSLKVA